MYSRCHKLVQLINMKCVVLLEHIDPMNITPILLHVRTFFKKEIQVSITWIYAVVRGSGLGCVWWVGWTVARR